MSQILSTDAVAPAQRVAYWSDAVCMTYVQLECDTPHARDFRGSIAHHRLPGLDFSVVRSCAQQVVRTPRAIACAADDYVIASLQLQGNAVISQDGRDALLSPGDFAIYDSTRPYRLQFGSDFEEVVLKMRGKQLRELLRDTTRLTATTVSGRIGAGYLLTSMVRTLRDEIECLSPASSGAVAAGVVQVLAAGLQSLPACSTAPRSSMAAYHLARIHQCMEDRLRDPLATIESMAAELGMSAGHLHRVFKAEAQSPAQYFWGRRLDACSRELLDPRRAKASVAEIAFGWGFNDAAHFSRAFRDRFRCTPRDWRRQSADASTGAAAADAVGPLPPLQ